MEENRKNKINFISSNRTKNFFLRDRKGKIIAVLLIVVTILVFLQLFASVPVSTIVQEPIYLITGFSQKLYETGDGNPYCSDLNMVLFPYCIVACMDDTSVEQVFKSILDNDGIQIVVFLEEPGATWFSWVSGRPVNTLTHIEAYKTYYVQVSSDCVLEISGCWS